MLKLIAFVTVLTTAAPIAPLAAGHVTFVDDEMRAPRVRTADKRIAELLLKGLERSATIRALVQELEQRNVIVYVEMQPTLKKRLAGTLTWLSATPSHRYVRISINPELKADLAIATLGHELQHAVEVANAPQIVDADTLARYYAEHGTSNPTEVNGWDTEAARLAGYDVRRELAGHRSSRVADSIQAASALDQLIAYHRARGMLPP